MARQNDIVDLNQRLEHATGAAWAGSRIDQADGGRLVVWTTDPSAVTLALTQETAALRNLVELQQVRFSYGELNQLATTVTTILGKSHVGSTEALVAPDPSSNSVLVKLAAPDQLRALGVENSAAWYQLLDSLLTGLSPLVVDRNGFANTDVSCNTYYVLCDVPLRGGVEIDGPSGCSAGFTVRSKSTHTPFLLTAGHCTAGHWYTGFSDGRKTYIGSTVPGYIYPTTADPDYDAQIMTIDNPSDSVGWELSTQTGVYVVASGDSRPTTRVEYYPIDAVGASCYSGPTCPGPNVLPQDTYVCWTGASFQTDCGRFHMLAGNHLAAVNTDDWGPCQGDSGGPVYAGHRGYGLIKGARFAATYNSFRYFSPGTVQCTPHQFGTDGMTYELLDTALAKLNMELIP